MSKKAHNKYDDIFKAQCVETVSTTHNGNISQAAKALGLPMQTLHNWVKRAHAGKLPSTVQFNPVLVALQEENKVLKKSLTTNSEFKQD